MTLRWQRAIARALHPLSLTHVQFVVLASVWWLNRNDRIPNQSAVAAHADVDIKMTSEILRKLEDNGLIAQRVDPRDRRARSIVITEPGAALAERAVDVVEQVDAEFFKGAPRSVIDVLKLLGGGPETEPPTAAPGT